jgi:hypothetical protein
VTIAVSAPVTASGSSASQPIVTTSRTQNANLEILVTNNAEAFKVTLSDKLNASDNFVKSVNYPRPASSCSSWQTDLVNWQAILNEPNFYWNFSNNPHMYLKSGTNVDSNTAKQII